MKTVVPGVLSLIISVIFLSSCQKEVEGQFRLTEEDQVIPMMRIVETDNGSPVQDSVVRILKTIIQNGEKTVELSEIYPLTTDTVRSVFSYNAGSLLSDIRLHYTSDPSRIVTHHKLTWTGNRLTKLVTDTFGVFSHSTNFTYTPSGANTLITATYIPSLDQVYPDHFFKYKVSLTVNDQFRVLKENIISHTYFLSGGNPTNIHDSAAMSYSYAGTDVSLCDIISSRHDTSDAGGSTRNIQRDTLQNIYERSVQSSNIADTLRKVYGNDVYTLMEFDMLFFFDEEPIFFGSMGTEFKYFNDRPLTAFKRSARLWINGVPDPSGTYTNIQEKKNVNTFDAQGRMTRMDVYEDFLFSSVWTIHKVYY